ALGGVSKAPGNLAVKFHNAAGDIEYTPASIRVDGKLHIDETIFGDAFTFLRSHVTTAVPKLTIPSYTHSTHPTDHHSPVIPLVIYVNSPPNPTTSTTPHYPNEPNTPYRTL